MKRKIKKRTLYKSILSVLIVIASVFMIQNISKELGTLLALKNDLSSEEQVRTSLMTKKKELQKETSQLKNKEYKELFYRGNCLLTKENEQVFIFKNNS